MKDIYKNLTKSGKAGSGNQLYKDKTTGRVIVDPLVMERRANIKKLAIKMVVEDGTSYRRAARLLGVSHPTVMRWVLNEADKYDFKSLVDYQRISGIEVDEIYAIIGKKKEDGNTSTSTSPLIK